MNELTQKIFSEYKLLRADIPSVPETGDAVVVLAAGADKLPDGTVDFRSQEQMARVEWGVFLALCIEHESGKMPLLVLNGENDLPVNSQGPTQLRSMLEIASKYIVPPQKIRIIDNVTTVGGQRVANTKTQFAVMKSNQELMRCKEQIVVTSGYHAPRVARTVAQEYLDYPEMNFEISGVPYGIYAFAVFDKIRGEIRRIHTYSRPREGNNRADIAAYLPDNVKLR